MPVKSPTESGQVKEGRLPNPKTETIKPQGDGIKRDVQNKTSGNKKK